MDLETVARSHSWEWAIRTIGVNCNVEVGVPEARDQLNGGAQIWVLEDHMAKLPLVRVGTLNVPRAGEYNPFEGADGSGCKAGHLRSKGCVNL